MLSCREKPSQMNEIGAITIPVDSNYTLADSIRNFITPYQDPVEQILDSALAYAPYPISKTDGLLNSTA